MDPRDTRLWLLLIVGTGVVSGVLITIVGGSLGLIIGGLFVFVTVALGGVLIPRRRRPARST